MRAKHLLISFMLLFVGGISAFSLTNSLPEEQTPDTGEPAPTEKPDVKALEDAYKAIESDTLSDTNKNKSFYEGITETEIYKAIGDTLKNTEHTATQDDINGMLKDLNKEIRKAPFIYVNENYKAKYEEYYGQWKENDAYMEIFKNSSFGDLKVMTESILETYKNKEDEIPINEVYGEPDTPDPDKGGAMIPGKRGIIRQYNECVDSLSGTFRNKKKDLKVLLDSISKNYSAIQAKEVYTTPVGWYTNENFTHKEHNLTDIILHTDYLKDEINFISLKNIYQAVIAESEESIKQYFSAEEQVDTNDSWTTAYAPLKTFKEALDVATIDSPNKKFIFNGKRYNSLSDMQNATNAMQNNLQIKVQELSALLLEKKAELGENIQTARTLLSSLVQGIEQKNNLNAAITNAEAKSAVTILSDITNAATQLKEAYKFAKAYYTELKTKLNEQIEEARKIDSSSFSQELTNAQTIYAKDDATDTEIISATEILKNKIAAAALRQTLNQEKEKLQTYQTTYGDEDGSIASLLAEAGGTIADEQIEALTSKIIAKIKATEATYDAAKDSLQNLIAASEKFSNDNPDKEGVTTLKQQIESAKNTIKATKVIVTVRQAYNDLNKVYMEVGGDAEAYLSRKALEKAIEDATACYDKYNYSNLLTLINTAQGYVTSDIKYLLDQQTQALKKGITTTIEQYTLLISRMDEQLTATRNKVTERYGEQIPENYQKTLENVTDSLAINKAEPSERVCTDISLLQKYSLSLQSIIKESDDAWNAAVADLWAAIQDADLKYQTDYSDKKDLGEAIGTANTKYENINLYPTIAEVKQIAKDLDNVLSNIEGPLRRNLAHLFTTRYKEIADTLAIYGSDENSLSSSNAKQYLEDKAELNEELSTTSSISYSLTQLQMFSDSALLVKDLYQLFCNSSTNLGMTIATARYVNSKYYNEDQTDTGLHKAIQNAIAAKEESHSKEIIEANNVDLKDSMRVTSLIYGNALRNMKVAGSTAKTKHIIYYGSKSESSEIMDIYNESQELLADSLISKLEAMTAKLDTCYKQAERICVPKEEAIFELIEQAEPLNLLMENNEFDNEIAQAINARYSNDGRIAAIDEHFASLKEKYDEQAEKYQTARSGLDTKLEEARLLLEKRADKNLSDTISLAESVLENAQDITAENASKYKELTDAQEWLATVMEKVNALINNELTDARNALAKAREEAIARHNLYYGAENTDSIEILTVYRDAEAYLTSDNPAEIIAMTDSVNKSYTRAAVECSQKEAGLDNLIRKSTPMVTLMDNEELAKIIIVARECRNRMDGRIVAIDSVRPSLQAGYEADCLKYDDAADELSDSIDIAKELLEIKKDEALQNAITAAEAVLDAADKTSASSTKYTELIMQTPILAKEMERVRILIKESETGIYAPAAEDREVEIYTTQGFLVKRVRLSDSNPFQSIPEGVYIVDGKKIYIHAK